MESFIYGTVNIIILSFFLYYIYNGICFIIFKSHKNNIVFAKKKIEISHINPVHFFTSIVSIYLLYMLIEYLFQLELSMIVIPFLFLYILISVTKLIPFKLYILSQDGIYFVNPHFRFSHITLRPYKKWKHLDIKQIYNKGDYFLIEIIDKNMGKVTVSLYYTDYYQIDYFK